MEDLFEAVGEMWNRVEGRVNRRGLLASEIYQSGSSNEPNPLIKNFEAELRSRAEAEDCEHCKYMVKSLEKPAIIGWRVKLDFSSLVPCAVTCALCSFILGFVKQDGSFMDAVNASSTTLRIVSNFVGSITNRGASNETEATNEGNGIYPQLTVTFAPNLDSKNVHITLLGLVWPIHEDGILPFHEAGSTEDTAFTGRLVKQETDCTLLSSWLQVCQANHGQVCQPSALPTLPDVQLRMIDVTRQCVVAAPPGCQYVALSYVWGSKSKEDRLVLSNTTYSRLAEKGGLAAEKDDVPQTFRDAITLVNRLGLKYLWIDALCIQQDDSADIEAQMSYMDQIYGCAILTVVCDTSSSDSGLPGVRPNTREVSQRLYKGEHVSLITTRRPPWSESEPSPWSTRGWTLQEDILSKRLLVFTPRQVFYNCGSATFVEHTIQETADGSLLPALDAMKSKSTTKDTFFWRRTHQLENVKALHELHEVKPFTPLEEYNALLRAYTQRNLTNGRDAINAFSGILKSLSHVLGDHFWGLPARYFTQMMHWHQGYETFDRNSAFPSWSWAGWMNGKGQNLTFEELQKEGPLDYLIDWYRLSDDGQHILLDDELSSKRGSAPNLPLIIPPKKRWEWKKSKGKDKDKVEPVIYTPPAMPAFSLAVFSQSTPNANKQPLPPTSHILRFWAISLLIAVSKAPEDRYNRYTLTYPGDKGKEKRNFGRITLKREWRESQPEDMQFIVLSRKAKNEVTLMLVEVVGDVAYRVELTDVKTTNEVWKKLKPEWRLWNLA